MEVDEVGQESVGIRWVIVMAALGSKCTPNCNRENSRCNYYL